MQGPVGTFNILARSSEKVPSHHPAHAHSYADICSPLRHSMVSNDFVC